MNKLYRWQTGAAALLAALALSACGGGGDSPAPPVTAPTVLEPGAPALSGNISADGITWINFRRGQMGLPVLTRNDSVDRAAQGHSDYQKTNDVVSHSQTLGMPGFTGARLQDRLKAAGYTFSYAGEVISATSSSSGFYMSEELITAIYHRFVMFEPTFKEIGAGSATTSKGYTYFTSNFGIGSGGSTGIGRGTLAVWPAANQTLVATNFFSDNEEPDPVPAPLINEVGYPVSVHADMNSLLSIHSFTMRPRGGSDLQVRLLTADTDSANMSMRSAAAIVPLSILKSATTYDVALSGTQDGVAFTKSWSFTTK